jgi:hypothetical protein
MAEVIENKSIAIMRFKTCDTIEIYIERKTGENGHIVLVDDEVRILYEQLKKWIEDEQ